MTLGVAELTFQTQEIDAITFRGFEAATAVTVIYVVIIFVFVQAMHLVERAMKLDLRSP
jgi:polar amino acid transport system permease protein